MVAMVIAVVRLFANILKLTVGYSKRPVQESEQHCAQYQAGTLESERPVIQREPSPSKIPREHDDVTDRESLLVAEPQQSHFQEWHQLAGALCEQLYDMFCLKKLMIS
ncbi:hypothetical protein QZH41_020439 [Actinostola sp. cb2023]|nr:hypothetical protein QZH41_020439 [Actinostola sp. cb2023]